MPSDISRERDREGTLWVNDMVIVFGVVVYDMVL